MAVYLLKFEPQFKHAKYYLGWCSDGGFNKRFNQHLSGNGAVIIRRAIEQGYNITVAIVVPGDRSLEARLKRWENNSRVYEYLKKNGWKK